MHRRVVVALVLASLLSLVAAGVQAAPAAVELPVTIKLNVTVPGTYILRFALSGEDAGVRWSGQMSPLGRGKKLASTTLKHLLGSLWHTVPGTVPENTALDPQLFSEQLWLQAFRWVPSSQQWKACSSRIKLAVVPYAVWSAISDGSGEQMVTTFMIRDSAVTAEKIQEGAVTIEKLGGSCPPEKPQLVYGPDGWACGTSLTCKSGDFLMCYDPAAVDRIFIGTCRPGVRLCVADGSGFGECVGAVLPVADACNGLDDDCDGVVDNPAAGVRLYEDKDGDGRGKETVTRTFCEGDQPGWAPLAGDCDDADPSVFAGAFEGCDSRDNDCDGAIDEQCRIAGECSPAEQEALLGCFEQCGGLGLPDEVGMCLQECIGGAAVSPECNQAAVFFAGCYFQSGCEPSFLDQGCAQGQCQEPFGSVFGRTPDCQYGQTRPCGDTPSTGICHQGTEACLNGRWSGTCVGAIFPGFEICRNDVDEDCDGSTTDTDNLEVCDGQDNDCDTFLDEQCVVPPGPACTAADRAAFDTCLAGGFTEDQMLQCFETLPPLSPACLTAFETSEFQLTMCVWERCFGNHDPGSQLEPNCLTNPVLCKEPYDLLFAGRLGECLHGTVDDRCGPPTNAGVCEYGQRTCQYGLWSECIGAIYPQPEQCEAGVDYDCDGTPNEGRLLFLDEDGDGFGSGAGDGTHCPEAGWVPQGGDCDDQNPEVHPGFEEMPCNGVDDDCNAGTLDEPDEDLDGFSVCHGDCQDWDPGIHPGAAEVCDGQDNDCNGSVDERDADGDGFSVCEDCSDDDATVNPGAVEICGDGKDNDCNALVDEGCGVCGDGFVAGGEACDDGGTVSGDGCSSACTVESGYQCFGLPSVCSALCGDGLCIGGENAQTCPEDCPF